MIRANLKIFEFYRTTLKRSSLRLKVKSLFFESKMGNYCKMVFIFAANGSKTHNYV